MIVPSLQFFGFAAVFALLFNIGRGAVWRQAVLLAANLLFLETYVRSPVSVLPFAGFLLFGYGAQRAVRGGARSGVFVALVALTILLFCWLKRYAFIPHDAFLPFPYVLVGLSYVFFRVLHVIIDSHQDAIPEPIGPLSYLNYTLNFTALTSGPIQRYQDYRACEVSPPPLDVIAAGRAAERIVIGYCKVAVVSMLLSLWQKSAIAGLGAAPPFGERIVDAALVIAIYPLYLYFNFSGYVDVVIGVARFFGIVLPENFDRPFAAENFINFWSRWHITLSSWLRTYVYNPLMMTLMGRITAKWVSPYLAVVAFFVTFFLVGVWHGQTSEFLFFGILQGGGVAANKLYQVAMAQRMGRAGYRALCAGAVYTAAMRGLTFTWFAFTLLWFWSSWGEMGAMAGQAGAAAVVLALMLIWAAATVVLALLVAARARLLAVTWRLDGMGSDGASLTPVLLSRYVRTAWTTALVVVTAATVLVLNSAAPDIVYKTF